MTYTTEQLAETVRLHRLWLNDDPAGVRANLSGADLRGADLRGADLSGATGNMHEIRSMQLDTWAVAYTVNRIHIGCQVATIDQWRERTPDDVANMADGAREWWAKWKSFILQAVELAPATPTGHESAE